MLNASHGKVVIGGERDLADLYLAPTVVTDLTAEDSLMTEEIFGPILPILTVGGVEEALQLINSRDKPLSLYVFSTDKQVAELFKARTSSGSMVFNDAVVHLSVETLPFGGNNPHQPLSPQSCPSVQELEPAGWGVTTGDTPSPPSLMRSLSSSGTSAGGKIQISNSSGETEMKIFLSIISNTYVGLENISERQDTRPMHSGRLTDWIFWSKTEKFPPSSSFCPT